MNYTLTVVDESGKHIEEEHFGASAYATLSFKENAVGYAVFLNAFCTRGFGCDEAGVVAVFNVNDHDRAVSGVVRPCDVLSGSDRYVYYEYYSGACGILDADGEIPVELADYGDKRLYTFLPYGDAPVCFGNVEMFIGVGTVTEKTENSVSLYEGGRIAFLSEHPLHVTDETGAVDVHSSELLTVVDVPKNCKRLYFREN